MEPRYFEFHNRSKLLSGENAIDHLPYELKNRMCKKPLIITDQMLVKHGHVKLVLDALKEGDIQIGYVYDKVPPDSDVKVCNEVAALFRQCQCDCLVAIGGGSVMDTSKGVNLTLTSGATDLLEVMGLGIIKSNTIPSIMIPTTSGTGSEATLVAVIANIEKQVKMEFISYNLVPDLAVLDPRMTMTLPPKLTAATGFDALVHAVEAYTCKQKNPISDVYAISTLQYISENLITAVTNGNDQEARMGMALASYMAGTAFSNSMVGMVHAIGHALGGVSHVPHGYAMAILLPHCMEYNLERVEEMYGLLLPYFIGIDETAKIPSEERGRTLIKIIKEMLMELNNICALPIKLSDCQVKEEDFRKIASTAINDGAALLNYKPVTEEVVMHILEKAF